MPLWVGGMEEGTKLDKKPLCSCPACTLSRWPLIKFITGPHTGRQRKEELSVVKRVTAKQLMEHYYFIGKQYLWMLHFSGFSKGMNCSSVCRGAEIKRGWQNPEWWQWAPPSHFTALCSGRLASWGGEWVPTKLNPIWTHLLKRMMSYNDTGPLVKMQSYKFWLTVVRIQSRHEQKVEMAKFHQ